MVAWPAYGVLVVTGIWNIAIYGALTGLTALATLFLGVLLAA